MKFSKLLTLTLALGLMAAPIAHAADAVDAKDDTRFKRFKDSDLIGYETKKYDEYLLPLDDYNTSLNTFNKLEKIEGQITRYVYRVPKGQSSLAAIRHYEEQLKTAKIAKTFELAPDQFKNEANFEDKLFMQNKTDTANIMSPLREGSQVPRYIAAQSNNKAADKSTTVSVMAVERATELQWKKPEMKDPEKEAIALNPGETIVVVDVIESKYHPVASQLSPSTPVVSTDTPDADDMAKQLEENGKVDIYGIYFDVDKTFIKAESNPTLEQVAKLMKANPNLSLKINGHTDNTGSIEHNMKLSDGRAKSVVDKLVKKYGVEKTRLQSEGYGDTKPIASNDTEEGKAKNRRVELSKVE